MALALGASTALAQTLLAMGVDAYLPDVKGIRSFNRPGTLTVLAADGSVLYKQGPATRDKLQPGKMPRLVQKAFIAAEDRRFYSHDGIDPVGILRAVGRNISQGSVEEGASTITQQLARMVFLSQDRTLMRKLREAALASKIERQLSKEQILEQYLNFVYLGSGAYGISDAAWVYFSKTPDQLTLPEAALIAGLPPAPTVYSPLVNPDLALKRRATVLRRMREASFIDDRQLAEALDAPLGLKSSEPKYFVNPAPWFISWLEQELPTVLTKEQLEVGGLTVRSSLNAQWQAAAQATIKKHASPGMEGALVSMEPGTGLVRAMVGGQDWNRSQFNRATQALRSPGSTFKLFTYTAALRYGMTPRDTISARERCYTDGWPPKRFCIAGTGGAMTLKEALTRSVNTAAVATAEKVGFPRVIETARLLGITGVIGDYPSMVLGANEKTVLEMTAAYAAINNRGLFILPTPFEEILGPDGKRLYNRSEKAPAPRRAVSSDVADAMMGMLQNVVRNGTGGGAALPDRPVAGKTGTAEGARDLWFIGSIPQLTTAIWFGFDQNWKTGSSSAQAAYAWGDYMKQVTKDLPVKPFPPEPVLTSKFIPYVPAKKRKPRQNEPAPASRDSHWDSPDMTNPDPLLAEPERRWTPPTDDAPQQGRSWQPEEPQRREPRSDPAPYTPPAVSPPASPATTPVIPAPVVDTPGPITPPSTPPSSSPPPSIPPPPPPPAP
ncbi:MAG: transglycosylase domain-containing protein [Cyanobacteriota bacterium]